jgi:hypothetical protein
MRIIFTYFFRIFFFKSKVSPCILFILAFACNIPSKTIPKQSQHKALRVFIIGNSFSQNATIYLPQLAQEGGYKLEIGRAEIGGCPLQKHWELAAAAEADPNNPKGKPYKGKSLKELLSDGKWDIVTIQQYSRFSSDIETYQPYASSLYKYIKAIQPHAEIAIHQTWSYRRDAKRFGLLNAKQEAQNDEQMYESLKANYINIAEQLKTRIIPTGEAFWKMRNHSTWAFATRVNTDTESLVFPELPYQMNSLHSGYKWSDAKKLVFDPNHANTAGCYLGSLVWYHFLFGAKLSDVKFKPETIGQEFARQLKKAAVEAFSEMGQVHIK